MRMRGTLTALLWMVACGPSVREVKTAEGEKAFEVSCEGDGAKCASAAKEQCPDGFGVIEESSTTTGPHLMTFRCQRNGDQFASKPGAERPSSGPSAADAIGSALAAGAKGFSDGLNNSNSQPRSCTDDRDCESDFVCVEAGSASSRRGVCVRRR